MVNGDPVRDATDAGYVHEAFFYDGLEELVTSSVEFVSEGLLAGEHVVVAVVPEKIEMLRAALRDQAEYVTWIDMADAGRNPARVIQLWRDLVDAAALRGAAVRGIGEPIWAGRTGTEILEAHLHEALLNVAFDSHSRLLLRCPYDVSELAPAVIRTAGVTHPEVVDDAGQRPSPGYSPESLVASTFLDPLDRPVSVDDEIAYDQQDLSSLWRLVAAISARHGLGPEAGEALTLSVREIAVNSVVHGGGSGRLRVWVEGTTLVCELSDSGHISQPLVGRLRPRPDEESGRGIWLANQLCDLVQIRSSPNGTVVRLHVDLRSAAEAADGPQPARRASATRPGSLNRGAPSA